MHTIHSVLEFLKRHQVILISIVAATAMSILATAGLLLLIKEKGLLTSVSAPQDYAPEQVAVLSEKVADALQQVAGTKNEVNSVTKNHEALVQQFNAAQKELAQVHDALVAQSQTLKSAVVQSGSVESSSQSGATNSGKININTASKSELETIPGVGPSIADRIIEYRTSSGGFQSIEGIMEVKGVGEATFAKMKDVITI